jgi:hypothetical protein
MFRIILQKVAERNECYGFFPMKPYVPKGLIEIIP